MILSQGLKKFQKHTLLRYCFVGGTSYIVELSVLLSLYHLLGFNRSIATAVSYWVGFGLAFTLQKVVAFRDFQKELKALGRQTTLYILLNTWNYIFTISVVSIFDSKYLVLSRTGALVVMAAWNFLFYKHVIFAPSKGVKAQAVKNLVDWLKDNAIVISSLIFLSAVSVYTALHANMFLVNNADDLIYPYLFKDFALHDIVLPGHHANILKFPLFALQAALPYNFFTFSVVSVGLVVLTTVFWAGLLIKLFGKRYAAPICFMLASILLGSSSLNENILGTTIRNIEFPIALGFVILINNLLKTRPFTRKFLAWGLIVYILYILSIAGDSLLQYAFSLPIIALIILYWVQSRRFTVGMWHAMAAVIVANVLGLLVKEAIEVLSVVTLYKDAVFSTRILPIEGLAPSLSIAATQTLNLQGANVFSRALSPDNLFVFVNFVILAVGIVGILLSLLRIIRNFYGSKPITHENSFILGVLGLSFISILAIYILSGQVVKFLPGGEIINAGQARYITLVPFLSIVGVAFLLKRYYSKHRYLLIAISLAFIGVFIVASKGIRAEQNSLDLPAANWRYSVEQAVETLEKNEVKLAITGYWYGSPASFRSNNQIEFASIAACNLPQPVFNNRRSWYLPTTPVSKSALLIDKSGPDSRTYWDCPDERILDIYGSPEQIIKSVGLGKAFSQEPGGLEIWIYNFDLRTKLAPYPEVK